MFLLKNFIIDSVIERKKALSINEQTEPFESLVVTLKDSA